MGKLRYDERSDLTKDSCQGSGPHALFSWTLVFTPIFDCEFLGGGLQEGWAVDWQLREGAADSHPHNECWPLQSIHDCPRLGDTPSWVLSSFCPLGQGFPTSFLGIQGFPGSLLS